MKFSVVVPVYNIENYVEKCILSIINQTYDDIELILVNDGSTDSSGAICEQYAKIDNRIILINKKNGGLVSARKIGAENATGEYTLYVDGDDWIDVNTICRVKECIEKYEPDCVCFGIVLKKNSGDKYLPVNAKDGLYNKQDLEREIYPYLIEDKKGKYFLHSACGKVYKTDILKIHQKEVDSRISIAEDAALTIPLISKIDTMYVIKDCLYYYNMLNVGSMTRVHKVLDWNNPYYLMQYYINNPYLGNYDGVRQQIYRNTLHNLFNVAISQFNSGLSYIENKKVIKENLSKEEYKEAIKLGKHSLFTINALADFTIRHEMCWILYLCWKLKYR